MRACIHITRIGLCVDIYVRLDGLVFYEQPDPSA